MEMNWVDDWMWMGQSKQMDLSIDFNLIWLFSFYYKKNKFQLSFFLKINELRYNNNNDDSIIIRL